MFESAIGKEDNAVENVIDKSEKSTIESTEEDGVEDKVVDKFESPREKRNNPIVQVIQVLSSWKLTNLIMMKV